MASMAPKEVPVIYLGVISLDPNYSSVALEMAEVWIIFLVTFLPSGRNRHYLQISCHVGWINNVDWTH